MPDGREFVVRIDPVSASKSCWLDPFQTGAYGGFGGPDARPIGGGAFAIRTGIGNEPARTLKVAVWCRGSGMALLDVPAVEASGYDRTVRLSPLPDVPLTGRVLPSADGVSLAGAEVHVSYVAPWLCGFFNLADCWLPQFEIASAPIGDDGTFRVLVPDFANDPVISRAAPAETGGPGGFKLRARNTAPYDYWLEPDGARSGLVPVARLYPQLLLHPRR